MEKIKKLFKIYVIPLILSISSFSWVILFLIIGRRIDVGKIWKVDYITLKNTSLEILNTDLLRLKYIIFVLIVLLICRIGLYLLRNCLGDKADETLSIKEIKPIEWSFLPVYIWLFVIALSFSESTLKLETVILMFILFLFWTRLDSVSYFNPFMLFFWYRFYEVKSDKSTTFTVITKRSDLKNITQMEWLLRINNFTFIDLSNATI